MKRVKIGLQIGGATACLLVLGIWAGCGGDTETQEQGTSGGGGSAGQSQDASSGGTGQGGTGQGGTGQGGTGQGGTGEGGAAGSGGSASCLLYHDTCDPNDDQCCAPMVCSGNDGGTAMCRSAQTDGAPSCVGHNKDCSTIGCCPGLECLDEGGNQVCGYVNDGGTGGSGGWTDGGTKEGGTKDGGSKDASTGQGGSGGTGGTGVGGSGGSSSCLLYHDGCDPTDNQCCAPMVCSTTGGNAMCRSPASDAAQVCVGQSKDCSTIGCCPGLECVTDGTSKSCDYAADN